MSHHSINLEQTWGQLTLAQQLGNVGSEVNRMLKWKDRDPVIAEHAFERMLELIDLTLKHQKQASRLREIARVREILVQTWKSSVPTNDAEWVSLNKYFFNFALL